MEMSSHEEKLQSFLENTMEIPKKMNGKIIGKCGMRTAVELRIEDPRIVVLCAEHDESSGNPAAWVSHHIRYIYHLTQPK